MKVQQFLTQQNVPFETVRHRPTYDAQSLAKAAQTAGSEVAKSVLLRADDKYVLAIAPATRTVDLHHLQELLRCKRVAIATEAECGSHFPDCELGALPPFGSQYGMQTIMDRSLEADEEILFEGNTHREAIRMRTEDYQRLEMPKVEEFCHPW